MIVAKMTPKFQEPKLRGSLEAIRWPALYEFKFDGELNWLVHKCPEMRVGHYHTYLINKYGLVRAETPVIERVIQGIGSSAILIGELVYGKGHAGDLYELNKHKADDGLTFIPFDIIMWDGQSMASTPLIDRKELLATLPHLGVRVRVVNSKAEALQAFEKVTGIGYEGIVVKPFDSPISGGSLPWVKMKKKDRSDFKVVLIDPTRERIEVAIPQPNGAIVCVGVKVMNRDKVKLRAGEEVTIEYQGILKSGSLRHPVFIGKTGVMKKTLRRGRYV